MNSDTSDHHRRSLRLREFNYSQAGLYYVTIVLHERRCLFGEISNDEMVLNPSGEMVVEQWLLLLRRFPTIELNKYQIMPNHFHGLIQIVEAGVVPACVGATLVVAHNDAQDSVSMPTLGNIIGAFKSITTHEYIREVKQSGWPPFNGKLWQRNYYEHIVRDNEDYERIADYIMTNPFYWNTDEENPDKPLVAS